jgi:hypothetical protein
MLSFPTEEKNSFDYWYIILCKRKHLREHTLKSMSNKFYLGRIYLSPSSRQDTRPKTLEHIARVCSNPTTA